MTSDILTTVDLARALQQTADSVMIVNRDGIIEYVNPAFEAITGFPRAEALGRTPALLRSGVQAPRFYATLWTTILEGRTFRSVLTNRSRDGRMFDLQLTITPMRADHGAITHFIAIGRDVTTTRREEALRTHELVEEETSRVATFLHAEAGQYLASAHLELADLARDSTPEVREQLDAVRRSLDRVEMQLRRVAHGGQPRAIADLGLVDAIRFLGEACTARTGLALHVESTLDRRCSGTIETLLYRFVQESLSHVTRAEFGYGTIVLSREVRGRRALDQSIRCVIRIAGGGLEVASAMEGGDGGPGLQAIQERLRSVGGTFAVVSSTGPVVELRAAVPVSV
jgi:PAS domain S-box-containing protein